MAHLSKLAVDRPVTFIMTTLVVIGFGLFGLSRLSLNLYPDVSFPTITIYTTYEGVAPEDIETLITRPIEEQVGSVSGLQRIRSLSSQGASVVKLYFNWGTDLFIAEADVRKQIDFARRAVPQDADQPIVFSYDPNQEPVIVLALSSPVRSSSELRTVATQQLEQRLERIPGIAATETAGGLERQINIWMRNDQIVAYGLDVAAVAGRLRQENIQVPAGELIEGRIVYSLRTIGEFKDVDQIRNTVIGVRNNVPVLLRYIADVEDGVAQPIGNVHVKGEEGLVLNLYRQSDVNVVTTAANVIRELDRIRGILPSDMTLEVLTNKADFIKLSLNNLYATAVQAILLVVIILLVFLQSVRTSLIVAISIPVSIVATFSVMDFADVTLNVISLSGLTLAVGLVVDNAVVVLENIFRYREEGKDGKTAAVNGAREVALPVVVSTLTTLVVLLPVLFVPGIAGVLFQDLALTVSFALVMSTMVALSLVPLLASSFFSRKKPATERKPNRLASALAAYFDRLDDRYQAGLRRVLTRNRAVIGGSVVLFLATLPIFNTLGGEFFPPVDENAFVLNVKREPGVNLFELQNTIYQVETVIGREVPETRLVVSDYGDKRGVEGADNPGGYQGTVRVELVPRHERARSQFEIVADLLQALREVPGAEIREVRQNPLNPEGEEGLMVNIFGFDLTRKKDLSEAVKAELLRVDGVVGASSSADAGRPELRVVMDRERIARLGSSTSAVAQALSQAVRGSQATTFVDQGVEHTILVQLSPDDKRDSRAIEDIPIRLPDGSFIPLRSIARIEREQGPSNILRINQERVTEVQADFGSADLKTVSDATRARLDQVEWPDGYRYELGGSAEDQAASFRFLMIAFIVAAVLAYMIMASQFESILEPFIIIVTIPLAMTGVLVMLWITDTAVSVTALIGLILLAGIVVNNGIVMIDYIKVLQSRGVGRFDAVVTGASRRLRPILMTAGTTVLSMVPLALEVGAGSETWSPMARTVIGGLTLSTALMLFVVPSLYYVINDWVERMGFDAVHKTDPLAEDRDAD
jgi:HAE1 family hydrophobic/amphiphilic exporter-1